MRSVSIFTVFLLIVIVSACEKEDILRIELKNKDPNQVTCRVPLTESIVAGELSTNSCGIHMNWNISKIADRFEPANIEIDVNGDNIKDFRIGLWTSYSPGGGSSRAYFLALNPEFSFGMINISYNRCLLGNFYYNQAGELTNIIAKGSGICEKFTQEQVESVDTVYRSTKNDNYLLALAEGDVIDKQINWYSDSTLIKTSNYQSGVWSYDQYGMWPYGKEQNIGIRRVKSSGQVEYGWITFLLEGSKGTVLESWIQND